MRIVFMGTPKIAEVALDALLADGQDVVGVFTRPDKPVGRKQVLSAPPVKLRAAENRIPVFQPATLRGGDAAQQLAALAPDLVVVVAYGMLLPPAVLAVPRYGCINLHVSLLPKWRGAAPIQRAVMAGDAVTGVSVMQMDEGLDTGPVLAQQQLEIPPDATAGEVFEMAGTVGARLLAQTVREIAAGNTVAVPQGAGATHAPALKKEEAKLDFSQDAKVLHNLVRGCNPWPLAWFTYGGKRVKVLRAHAGDAAGKAPGEVLATKPLTVACGAGSLTLEHVVPEGAAAMTGAEWALGRRFLAGDNLLDEG